MKDCAEKFQNNTYARLAMQRKKLPKEKDRLKSQFKSPGPGMGGRGKGYMRQPSYPGTPQGYPYSPGYSGRSPMPMGLRGAEGIEYYQGGDEGYDYQQGASDDSRDTQHSSGGDVSQHQMGFGGEFGDSQQGYDQAGDSAYAQDRTQGADASGAGGSGNNSGKDSGAGGGKSPPDIKYEVTPMPFIKADDFELIEIDPDEEDDL